MSRIHLLFSDYGQSVWLDYIDHDLLGGGGLASLVAEGVRGVTSNPTIFHKAITGSGDYDQMILELLRRDQQIGEDSLYRELAIRDIRVAADILEPVYAGSDGADGFVSLEVSPHLAYDTGATIAAAHDLWYAVGRPNLMIKVPATEAGLPAIERLIAEGINVNVTLLFSVERYQAVAEAYIRGLSSNSAPDRVASVASFFVSRVDTKIDAALEAKGAADALSLKGRIAIANAKAAYRRFREVFGSNTFTELRKRGGRPQRPLWASTGTKDPAYSDVLYVEELIGRDTVNTLPPDTLNAFQDHGRLHAALDGDLDGANRDLEALNALGIDMQRITADLEQEGVDKFIDSHDQLLTALKEKIDQMRAGINSDKG